MLPLDLVQSAALANLEGPPDPLNTCNIRTSRPVSQVTKAVFQWKSREDDGYRRQISSMMLFEASKALQRRTSLRWHE